jgi:DNA repair exonuclease SbcCD nuclease subunit
MAGDLFDNEYIDAGTRRRVVDLINSFAPIPVYIIPGNHDPLMPGSIWEREEWSKIKEHVHFVKDEEKIPVGQNTVLFASPLKQKTSDQDPTAWIPAEATNGTIRIGLAHGSLASISDVASFPIAVDRCQISRLDYLALGDWHGKYQSGKIVYSGSMEPTKFGEDNSGYVAIVDIPRAGADPEIRFLSSKALSWVSVTMGIQDDNDVNELGGRLSGLGDLSSTILKVETSLGELSADAMTKLEDLRKEYSGKAFTLYWDLDTESISGVDSTSLPAGVLTQTDTILEQLSQGVVSEGSVIQANSETAIMARKLLRRIARGDDI